MKKIKKLLLLAIAGAIFFTLAGCSSKQSEEDLIDKVLRQTEQLEAQEADISPSGTAAERCHTPQMCHLWANRAGRSESGISFLLQMQWKL